jgi:hypothetical protein
LNATSSFPSNNAPLGYYETAGFSPSDAGLLTSIITTHAGANSLAGGNGPLYFQALVNAGGDPIQAQQDAWRALVVAGPSYSEGATTDQLATDAQILESTSVPPNLALLKQYLGNIDMMQAVNVPVPADVCQALAANPPSIPSDWSQWTDAMADLHALMSKCGVQPAAAPTGVSVVGPITQTGSTSTAAAPAPASVLPAVAPSQVSTPTQSATSSTPAAVLPTVPTAQINTPAQSVAPASTDFLSSLESNTPVDIGGYSISPLVLIAAAVAGYFILIGR